MFVVPHSSRPHYELTFVSQLLFIWNTDTTNKYNPSKLSLFWFIYFERQKRNTKLKKIKKIFNSTSNQIYLYIPFWSIYLLHWSWLPAVLSCFCCSRAALTSLRLSVQRSVCPINTDIYHQSSLKSIKWYTKKKSPELCCVLLAPLHEFTV